MHRATIAWRIPRNRARSFFCPPPPDRAPTYHGAPTAPVTGHERTDLVMLPLVLSLALVLPGSDESEITVRCDARVELLMIVFRLAGAEEYRMDGAQSSYSHDVDRWFQPFANHAVIGVVREQRTKRGVSHDAVPGLAVHLDNASDLNLRVPLDPWPEKLDARWTSASIAEFL